MFFRVLLRTYLSFLLLLCRDIIDYVKPVIVKEAKEKKTYIYVCVCAVHTVFLREGKQVGLVSNIISTCLQTC